MTRVKRGAAASKRRKKIIKMAKGFRWRRKSNFRAAKEALLKAGKYAYRDRRNKKREQRGLWILRFNNALREHGLKYSSFIKTLKEKNIQLNRKAMSQMAVSHPEIFSNFIEKTKQELK